MAGTGVKLKYGGQTFGVATNFVTNITSPTPLMTVETSANADMDKNILSFISSITLDGVIIGTGINQCMSSYSGLINYFSDPNKQGKTFEVLCDDKLLVAYSGTLFKSLNLDKSDNNWAVTIPYTVSLESAYPASGVSGLIASFEDSWTIEPLEEVYYFEHKRSSPLFNINSNSNLDKPPSPTDLTEASPDVKVQNLLQYRITHKVSAVGQAIDTTNTDNPISGGGANTNNGKSAAYIEAAKWVSNRAGIAYGSNISNPTGIRVFNDTSTSGLRLYNHIRSIESNVSAGSYGITDTWLALATGITFVEDFSWEISTDDRLIKTVTLNGTIKGLEDTTINNASGYVIFPSGAMTGNISKNFGNNFAAQTSTNNRFSYAISGYQSGVKPFLYERASLALSSVDRPINGTVTQPIPWIGPPKWSRLNVTPISYTETLSPVAGTVTYSVTYSNRPGVLVSGALSNSLTITDTNPSDQIAEIFVLGRPLGPVLEKVGTTKSERRVSLEVVFTAPTGYNQMHPNSPECILYNGGNGGTARPEYNQLKNLMESFRPIAPTAFATLVPTSPYGVSNQGQGFKTADSSTWNPFEGRFSWEMTWIYNTGICT